VVFSHDGRRLVTASVDGTARIWDAHDDKADPIVLSMPNETVTTAALSADARRVVTISQAGDLRLARIWNAADGTLIKLLDDKSRIAWTDGRHIVIGEQSGAKAGIWQVESLDAVGTIASVAPGSTFASSSDGGRIAVTGKGVIRLWDAAGPAEPAVVDARRGGRQLHQFAARRLRPGA
jgi:WD40 repeat protein